MTVTTTDFALGRRYGDRAAPHVLRRCATRQARRGLALALALLVVAATSAVTVHAAAVGVHGLRLPASFTGTLPCADCEGIAWHLDLWPDQGYHLRREWLGRQGESGEAARLDQVGRWYVAPGDRDVIVLPGDGDDAIRWQVLAPDRLRLLDRAGEPIESRLNYELASSGTLRETDIDDVLLGGMMTYYADAALFEDCLTGRRYPIVHDGDYLALERAYLADRSAPGAPLYIHVDGSLLMRPAMEGPDRRSLVVKRFVRTRPGISCERQQANAALVNTYWRIDRLGDEVDLGFPERREPHIILRGGDEPRFAATLGCNQLIGSFSADGEKLSFAAGPSTLMACPPPVDHQEIVLTEVLMAARTFRINGETLTLRNEDAEVIAVFTAVYLQ
ncbi:MAG: META domain-containing protein [Halieaceae bacterium]|jgi:copper homeostasis protein (lipoprotein)|nr:META domain-containing protein [Halieaceae bacterium]